MLEKFLKVIERDGLVSHRNTLLVAVSGGVDSMVLIHLLKEAKLPFAIAHCNFQLRDKASEQDEAFVRATAHKMDVPFFIETFNINNYATKKGISTQMAARELRYGWFEQLMVKHDFDWLLTAHHLNDSLETTLLNLAKGTGLSGLRGISSGKNNLARPLLSFTKEQIIDYAKREHIEWREDTSNHSTKYKRNLIRHDVIPVLKEINPGLLATFRQTQQRLQATEVFLEGVLQEKSNNWVRKIGKDIIIDFKEIDNIIVLDYLLKPYGFKFDQVKNIMERMAQSPPGKVFYTTRYKLNIDRDSLILSPKHSINEPFHEVSIHWGDTYITNGYIELEIDVKDRDTPVANASSVASMDLGKLKFPLTLRKWRDGDSFYPLGMKGKKKVSDFMIDNKIPLNLKDRVFVLTSSDDIAWVVGHRLDNRFKVTSNTQKICFIHMHLHDQSI
ncbi:tRNA lysidine(34) synthetase TilS [Fulvivirga sp. M361]|uniref:tRNA lysidine(34) synthetase TilS n=1 Tax=Fulvivirga sp. M361 TaxID=2594266 RepID=UPI0011798C46|nr:tRNA lysidine(34) synthetase TilS [Fulvivirga sp. M361]TRX52013.1 tRNA lysidine(34) synthetase TilS [Fulvivirga sp. M361]